MLKTILIILLGLFFIINGLNHFLNRHTIEEYARRRNLISPSIMVKLSGILLLTGGLCLITGYGFFIGIYLLCIFLVVASFSIHKFWAERQRDMRMLELMHFLKNFAILVELLYIAETTAG